MSTDDSLSSSGYGQQQGQQLGQQQQGQQLGQQQQGQQLSSVSPPTLRLSQSTAMFINSGLGCDTGEYVHF